MVERAAALDVGKHEVVASRPCPWPCRRGSGSGRRGQEVRKTLEDAGIKLDSVAADVLGVSGRRCWASRAGRCWARWSPANATPRSWPSWPRAGCARSSPSCARRCAAASATTTRCWSGRPLTTRGHLEGAIAALDGRIDEVIAPFAVARDRLGDHHRGRQARRRGHIAEIGVDMTVFPTAGHLASRAGRCPGNNGTGGKRRSASRPGQPVAGRRADRVRLGRCQKPGHLSTGPVLAAGPAHRQAARRRSPWATPSW
jgi:transposase